MTFATQSPAWLEALRTRRRSPVKPATLRTYDCFLRYWILPNIGDVELGQFSQSRMKSFIAALAAAKRTGGQPKLTPKSIVCIVAVVKKIVASAVDEDGVMLYPRLWDHNYIDLPIVSAAEQRTPIATVSQVERSLRQSSPRNSALYALLAGSGLRIGEAMAVRNGDDGTHTAWDAPNRRIVVRTAFHMGLEQSPKTDAGKRIVDISTPLNNYLQHYARNQAVGGFLFTREHTNDVMSQDIARYQLRSKYGVHGFHALRRLRTTHLQTYGVPDAIVKYWIGHAPPGVTGIYTKVGTENDAEVRRSWAERAGLGFELPKKISQAPLPTEPKGDENATIDSTAA